MRMSSLQTFLTGVRNITSLTGQVNKTQEKISSGTRVLTPADDPVAASRIMKLNQDSAQRGQWQDNIKLLDNRLQLEDSTLQGVNDLVIRLKELTVKAGNGILTADDKKAISAELKSRFDELQGTLNTRDASGEYIFAGFKGSDEPFVSNGLRNVSYEGDEGVRFVKIASSTFISSGDSGKELFVDIQSEHHTFTSRESPTNRAVPPAEITAGLVVDQDAYDLSYPEDYFIEFQNPNDMVALAQPAQANYNVIQKSDGRVIQANVAFTENTPIVINGLQVNVVGTPAIGDSFIIESTDKQDVLTTMSRLIEGLETLPDTPEGRLAYDQLIADSLGNIDHIQTSVLNVRADLGARLNTVESTRELHETASVISSQLLSHLRDLDYAEAVSELTFESFVLEAAQQSFVKISGLSLFNRL